ncbi:hypothetical protein [Azospirillum melinis]
MLLRSHRRSLASASCLHQLSPWQEVMSKNHDMINGNEMPILPAPLPG